MVSLISPATSTRRFVHSSNSPNQNPVTSPKPSVPSTPPEANRRAALREIRPHQVRAEVHRIHDQADGVKGVYHGRTPESVRVRHYFQ